MSSKDEAERSGRPRVQSIILVVILVVAVIVAAWSLAIVSTTSQIPSSDFVALPTTTLSRNGVETQFVHVTGISSKGVAVGVKGYLETASGSPVVGAIVYVTYYLQGAYRTQAATTDQNGYFQITFPMNWTGWLPLTLTYYGDDQHQGLTQAFGVSGENL